MTTSFFGIDEAVLANMAKGDDGALSRSSRSGRSGKSSSGATALFELLDGGCFGDLGTGLDLEVEPVEDARRRDVDVSGGGSGQSSLANNETNASRMSSDKSAGESLQHMAAW